jgi:hypothetical protein
MKTEDLAKASGVASSKRKYLSIAIIGIALAVLTGCLVQKYDNNLVNLSNPASQVSASSLTVSKNPTAIKPLFYKKQLVFKRTLAKTEDSSIRTSAKSDGYKALSVIPPTAIIPQITIRSPQFPNSSALRNYQTLSILGSQQYYNNSMNNLKNQQFLNQSNQYMDDLNNRQLWNNLNTQLYLNNFNQNMQNEQNRLFSNNLNNQQYLNNFNNPTFYRPMPQIYTPPSTYNYRPAPQFYNPPPIYHFP